MICANPECDNEFIPRRTSNIYCCRKCANRVGKIKETAERRAKAAERIATMMHPCKKCGEPVGYNRVFCDRCKAVKKGGGIPPLTSKVLRSARSREQALIDAVVAKALASGAQGPQDLMKFRRRTNYRAVKVG